MGSCHTQVYMSSILSDSIYSLFIESSLNGRFFFYGNTILSVFASLPSERMDFGRAVITLCFCVDYGWCLKYLCMTDWSSKPIEWHYSSSIDTSGKNLLVSLLSATLLGCSIRLPPVLILFCNPCFVIYRALLSVSISISTFSSFHDIIFASLDFLVSSILRPNYFLTVSILDS